MQNYMKIFWSFVVHMDNFGSWNCLGTTPRKRKKITYRKTSTLHQGYRCEIHSISDITNSPYTWYIGTRILINLSTTKQILSFMNKQ